MINVYDKEIELDDEDYDDDYETLWLIWLIKIIQKLTYQLI